MTSIRSEFYFNSGTLLKGVNMPDPDLIISNQCLELYGYDISDYCFLYSKDTLQSFSFEPNPQLTTIGKYAFYGCTKLKRIDLSSCIKLNIIKESAFSYCKSVTEILLPEGLKYIGTDAFTATKITSIEIPSTVTFISSSGLGDMYSLTSVVFREGSKLESLSNNMFISTKLVEFTIPESVRDINGAFVNGVVTLTVIKVHQNNKYFIGDNNCAVYSMDYSKFMRFAPNSSSTYVINSKVTYINYGAFMNAKCTSITIPPSVTYIGGFAFRGTKNLKQIALPPNLTEIQGATFGSSGLTSIEIPDKVTIIHVSAFGNCNSLNTVILPSSLSDVGGSAFPSNPNINFTFKGDSSIKIDSQMIMMAKDNTSISLLLDSSATSISIPSQVKRIKSYAFSRKTNLQTISCEGSSEVEYIEDGAFSNCNSLTSIPYFPKLKEIGLEAFSRTKLSSEFSFPESFSLLKKNAFYEVSTLPSISFSSTVSILTIQESSFIRCSSLRSVSFIGCSSDIIFGANVFAGCSSLSVFNVNNKIKNIDSGCFMNSGLSTITFENSITSFDSLPSMLLKGCTNLNEINIPKNIISIGNECFSQTSIKKVSIPESVESLFSQCFSGCTQLERIDISSTCSLSKIFPGILEGCISLSYISDFSNDFLVCHNSTIYDINFSRVYLHAPACKDNYISFDRQLESVADSAFINCAYIEFVVFVDSSVGSIGRRAFESCIRLKQISIPSSVSYIGENAFMNCTSLKCGVLFQNKSKIFIDTLLSSGLTKSSLHSCDAFSCKSQKILNLPVSTTLFTVLIPM